MCARMSKYQKKGCTVMLYKRILVGCPCVATAYNNTHVNHPPKKFQDFLLTVSALRIIFFDLAN
jgi:hypothetical protein